MNTIDFPEGLIELDSEAAKKIGFTSDTFTTSPELTSQLYRDGDCIYIVGVLVKSELRQKGHLNALLDKLWSCGFTIKVPNPLRTMYNILKAKGFDEISEPSITSEGLDVVLVKAPPGCSQHP